MAPPEQRAGKSAQALRAALEKSALFRDGQSHLGASVHCRDHLAQALSLH